MNRLHLFVKGRDCTLIAEKVADFFSEKFHAELRDIYFYGMILLIDNVGTIFILLVFGFLKGEVEKTLIFLVSYISIRSHTGGYHARTVLGCKGITLIQWGVVVYGSLWIYKKAFFNSAWFVTSLFFFLIVVKLYAPVKHPNKKMREEVRKKNKKGAFRISFLFCVIATMLWEISRENAVALILCLNEITIFIIVGRRVHERKNNKKSCGNDFANCGGINGDSIAMV